MHEIKAADVKKFQRVNFKDKKRFTQLMKKLAASRQVSP